MKITNRFDKVLKWLTVLAMTMSCFTDMPIRVVAESFDVDSVVSIESSTNGADASDSVNLTVSVTVNGQTVSAAKSVAPGTLTVRANDGYEIDSMDLDGTAFNDTIEVQETSQSLNISAHPTTTQVNEPEETEKTPEPTVTPETTPEVTPEPEVTETPEVTEPTETPVVTEEPTTTPEVTEEPTATPGGENEPQIYSMNELISMFANETVDVQIAGVDGQSVASINVGKITDQAPEFRGYSFVNATIGNNIINYVAVNVDDEGHAEVYYSIGEDLHNVAMLLGENDVIVLNYEKTVITHKVTYIASPSEGGTITGDIKIAEGESISIEAIQNPNYNLKNVEASSGRLTKVNDNLYTLSNVTKDVTVTATYEKVTQYTIDWNCNSSINQGNFDNISFSYKKNVNTGGNLTLTLKSDKPGYDSDSNKTEWHLDSLVANGKALNVPTSYTLNAIATTMLSNGTKVEIKLTKIEGSGVQRTFTYTVTLSNVSENVKFESGNFKSAKRAEIIVKELASQVSLNGYDAHGNGGSRTLYANDVVKQRSWYGNDFYYNVESGYNVTIRVVGANFDQKIEATSGKYKVNGISYSYKFNIPTGFGKNESDIKLYITAERTAYRTHFDAAGGLLNASNEYSDYSYYAAGNQSRQFWLPVIAPTAPTGKVFTGWKLQGDNSGKLYKTGEVFNVNLTSIAYADDQRTFNFIAQYKNSSEVVYGDETTYHVRYFFENPLTGSYEIDENKTLEVAGYYGVRANKYSVEVFEGYEFDSTQGNRSVVVTADDTDNINLYYKCKKYTVTYLLDGEQYGAVETYALNQPINPLRAEPEKEGYTFSGWTPNELPTVMPSKNITIEGYFTVDPTDVRDLSYTVEYYKDGVHVEGDDETVTKSVWSGTNMMPVDVANINTTDKYAGYDFVGSDPTTIPAEIAGGSTIKVYYVVNSYNYKVSHIYRDAEDNVVEDLTTTSETRDYLSAISESPRPATSGNFVLTNVEVESQDQSTLTADKDGNVTGTMPAEDLTITFFYDADENHDEIPDKYQITVTYRAVNGTITANNGPFTLNKVDANGDYAVDGVAHLTVDQIATATANEGYHFVSWTPEVPTTEIELSEETEFVANFAINEYTAIVNYVNEDTNEVIVAAKEVAVKHGETVNGADHVINIEDYVYTNADSKAITEDNMEVNVYYSADENHDEIPDKYQITVSYRAVNGTITANNGPFTLNKVDANGNYAVDGVAHLTDGQIAKASPNNGYQGGTWSPMSPTTTLDLTDDTTFTITFTATPTDPDEPNPGCPEGTVWDEAAQACLAPFVPGPEPFVPGPGPVNPGPEEEVIVEPETPEQGGTATPTPTPEIEEIEEPEQPEVGHEGSWALINLIASLLGLLAALFLIFAKHQKDDDEEDQNQSAAMNEEDPEQLKRKRIYKWISGLTAVVSIIVFVLTENMRLPMILVDKWTLLMVVFFLINAVTLYLGRRWHENEDDEEQTQA